MLERPRGLLWRRFGAAMLAPLLFLAVLTAGKSFLWCSMMEQVMSTCCCTVEADPADTTLNGPALRGGCCAHRAIEALPTAHASTPVIDVPPCAAAPVATIPEPSGVVMVAMPSSEPPVSICNSRYGPSRASPRSALSRCAVLQVFRC